MLILGIESSCDETSASVVEDGRDIHSLVTASQTEIHAKYHGVVPEVASRAHVEHILPVAAQALREAAQAVNADPSAIRIDGVAATNRPGLSGSLAVGLTFAKSYAYVADLPFVAVDHMHAHAYAARLAPAPELEYPYLVLLVSGGHSMVAVSRAEDELEVLGTTIDDACGEAYDKVSAFIGTGYPGGPAIDRLAQAGDPRACRLPRPRLNHARERYDVSFSGLKTAVVHQLDRFWNDEYPRTKEHLAAAFQDAAIEMLVDRLCNAIEDTGIRRVVAGGGVAANSELRRRLKALSDLPEPVEVVLPPLELCIDNGAMVAGLGYHLLKRGRRTAWDVGVAARVPEFRGKG
ncbi:MAG: tRNA (adenosine(37)-N6)-threonylcarbamoyltransferase complex transferase subunit TsaD [Spirochaetales bacterium]|nr:tRNA (adenosine(37)-N6)-threonylcarbamoyltransferase complex transferase subunit TsaD [Spirochaetales bacterium]